VLPQDFRGEEMPTAVSSLQKTAKKAGNERGLGAVPPPQVTLSAPLAHEGGRRTTPISGAGISAGLGS